MPRPLTLSPPAEATSAELRRRFDATADAETRLRYQMVWLAHRGQRVPEIARTVLRRRDTVARVLHRFRADGPDAVPRRTAPRRTAPGPARTVTPEWEAELLRVIELDPRAVGVPSANWTTRLLADYLATATGVRVSPETVRLALHARDYVCKRPTWTLERRASEQPGYPGNAWGWRWSWRARSSRRLHRFRPGSSRSSGRTCRSTWRHC
jgi:transposase